MISQAQKTPLAASLEDWGQRKALAAIDLLGQSLPASVVTVVSSGIVVIKFEVQRVKPPLTLPNIKVPVWGSEYVRIPIQKGMKGVAIAADAYLGGMSGLGGGIADLTPRPNLSTLFFAPLGSTSWSPTEDPNAVVLYGPDGTILRDQQGRIKLYLQPARAELDLPSGVPFLIQGNVAITGGLALGGNITAEDGVSVYTGDIKTSGKMIAGSGTLDQVGLQTHTHTQPNDSHGDAEGPTSSPTAGT